MMPSDIVSDPKVKEDWWPRLAKKLTVWRVVLSNWLSLMALGCLLTTLSFTAFLLWQAWQQKLYARPGGFLSSDREFMMASLMLVEPVTLTFVFGLLSLALHRNWRAGVVLIANVIFFVVAPL